MTRTQKNQQFQELNVNHIRKRALELIAADHSWRAFFLGKANARRHAGFTTDELKAIENQNALDEAAYSERKKTITDPAPYLRRRAKELDCVDSSWKLICLCFEKENARLKAGFTHQEIANINIQRKTDFEEKLADSKYIRKRKFERDLVDISWTAVLFGRDYARTRAGFEWKENQAIDNAIAQPSSWLPSLTGYNKQQLEKKKAYEKEHEIRMQHANEIREQQAIRKDTILRKKQ